MPALQHLGGDRWRTSIYIGRDHTGRQIRRTRVFTATDRRAAEIRAEAERVALRAIEADQQARAGTLAAYVDRWLAECATRLSPHTIEGYRIQSAKAVAQFGGWQLDAIHADDLRAWYARLLHRGVTPTTLEHVHVVLRIIFRQAVADDLIVKPPTFGIRRPRVPRRKFNLPPDAAIAAAISTAHPDLAIGATLAALGLRRAEVTRATWGDITGRELHVRGTKTDESDRYIALSDRTMRALAVHRRRQVANARRLGRRIPLRNPARPILANIEIDPTARTPYDPGWVTRTWRAITTRPGSPVHDMHFHDLRHWAASRLFAKGVAPHEVAEQLGHSKVSTTLDVYGQVLDRSAQRRARAKLLG